MLEKSPRSVSTSLRRIRSCVRNRRWYVGYFSIFRLRTDVCSPDIAKAALQDLTAQLHRKLINKLKMAGPQDERLDCETLKSLSYIAVVNAIGALDDICNRFYAANSTPRLAGPRKLSVDVPQSSAQLNEELSAVLQGCGPKPVRSPLSEITSPTAAHFATLSKLIGPPKQGLQKTTLTVGDPSSGRPDTDDAFDQQPDVAAPKKRFGLKIRSNRPREPVKDLEPTVGAAAPADDLITPRGPKLTKLDEHALDKIFHTRGSSESLPLTLSSSSSSSMIKYEKEEGSPADFCKGAMKFQQNLYKAMVVQSRPLGMYTTHSFWKCQKCTFEGPLRGTKADPLFDNQIYLIGGIRYRWTFLAKSHIHLKGRFDSHTTLPYGCIFCFQENGRTNRYDSLTNLAAHLQGHRLHPPSHEIQRRSKCVFGIEAPVAADWDINFMPVVDRDDGPAELESPATGISIHSSTHSSNPEIHELEAFSSHASQETDRSDYGDAVNQVPVELEAEVPTHVFNVQQPPDTPLTAIMVPPPSSFELSTDLPSPRHKRQPSYLQVEDRRGLLEPIEEHGDPPVRASLAATVNSDWMNDIYSGYQNNPTDTRKSWKRSGIYVVPENSVLANFIDMDDSEDEPEKEVDPYEYTLARLHLRHHPSTQKKVRPLTIS